MYTYILQTSSHLQISISHVRIRVDEALYVEKQPFLDIDSTTIYANRRCDIMYFSEFVLSCCSCLPLSPSLSLFLSLSLDRLWPPHDQVNRGGSVKKILTPMHAPNPSPQPPQIDGSHHHHNAWPRKALLSFVQSVDATVPSSPLIHTNIAAPDCNVCCCPHQRVAM